MVVDDNQMEQIRQRFNLNLYEVKVWTALLTRGISTAGDISEIAGVPRSRTYDVLETLEKKGFVVMKLGKPIKYIALNPDDVIARIKKRISTQFEERIDQLDQLRDSSILGKLETLYNEGIRMLNPSEMSGSLKGRYNIHDHLDLMINDAISSVDIIVTEEGLRRLSEYHTNVLKDASDRGVKIRIAAPIHPTDVASAKYLLEFAELRHIEHIKARFTIIDEEEVMFMVLPDSMVHPTYDTGIWVHSPFFAKALSDLFNHTWEHLEHGEKAIHKAEKEEK